MAHTTLVWFRRDLRITDNPALTAAVRRGGPIHAVYVNERTGPRPSGAASRWWLHQSLSRLAKGLGQLGIPLTLHEGSAEHVLPAILRMHDADALFWNRRFEPAAREIDAAVKASLRQDGVEAESFRGDALVEPFDILTGGGGPYSVYTPFWRALRQRDVAVPLPAPEPIGRAVAPDEVIDVGYAAPAWSGKLTPHWEIGEAAAQRRLIAFLDERIGGYPIDRDRPDREGTSRLSPHLAFGEISPRQVWHASLHHVERHPEHAGTVEKFLSELGWRDFHLHQLFHRANIAQVAMQPKFDALPWRQAPGDLNAWQRGETGIPIVDAGMRELWATGYMHNRVRMLAGSLLTKNLMIDWRAGEQWFWDTLCDADAASNPGNWQWVAGCGLDAAPYFRIFNPALQGEKFDPGGRYVRKWVPELEPVSTKWVHRPWDAPAAVRREVNYPEPIVDLRKSRARALEAFETLRPGKPS